MKTTERLTKVPQMKSRQPQKKNAAQPRVEKAESWDLFGLFSLALAGMALLMLLTVGLRAQEPAGPPVGSAEWREQALRQHRERLRQAVEERQAREAAEQQQQGEERGRPQQAEASSAPNISGSAEVLSAPLNVVTEVAEHFFTSVDLHNTAGVEIDHIDLVVNYDPYVIRPIQVSDSPIRNLLAEPGRLSADLEDGVIRYEGYFARTFKSFEAPLIEIEWEAIVPTPRTQITLGVPQGTQSSITLNGFDILGERGNLQDGTVATDIAIRPSDSDNMRGALLINDSESLRAVQGFTPRGGIELALEPSPAPIHEGDAFYIDVNFINALETPIDDLRFAIIYDPDVFEVIDAAPGDERNPTNNTVVGGVNLLDAPFRSDFPFDYYVRNDADNSVGLADYRMGLSRPRPLRSGTVARIYMRALAPAEDSPILFLHGDDLRMPTTSVRCIGVDVMGELNRRDDGMEDLAITVLPPVVEDQMAGHDTESGPSVSASDS